MLKYVRVSLLLVCMGVFTILMVGVRRGMTSSFDQAIFEIFIGVEDTGWFSFFKVITYLGSSLFIGCGSLVFVLYLWIRKKDFLAMAVVSIGVAGGDLFKRAIKQFIHRDRPGDRLMEAPGYSFPSGHSMMSMIFFCLVAYFILNEIKSRSRKWAVGSGFLVLILFIGASRIALRVHFPSDVLAGFSLGLAYGICCFFVYRWLLQREGREKASP